MNYRKLNNIFKTLLLILILSLFTACVNKKLEDFKEDLSSNYNFNCGLDSCEKIKSDEKYEDESINYIQSLTHFFNFNDKEFSVNYLELLFIDDDISSQYLYSVFYNWEKDELSCKELYSSSEIYIYKYDSKVLIYKSNINSISYNCNNLDSYIYNNYSISKDTIQYECKNLKSVCEKGKSIFTNYIFSLGITSEDLKEFTE